MSDAEATDSERDARHERRARTRESSTARDAASERRHRAALSQRRSSCWSRRSCRRSRPTQRVNLVTPALFKRYPDARALAEGDDRASSSRRFTPPASSARNRSRSIGMAQALVEQHGGEVPARWRRSSSCPASAARRPTSCSATRSACPGCRSIGTCCASPTASASPKADDPEVVEQQLCAAHAARAWTRASDTLILHGRRICRPKPLCDQCAVRDDCDYYRVARGRQAWRRAQARESRPRQ